MYYTPLDLETIRGDLNIPADLYLDENGRLVLYRAGSIPFTAQDRDRLRKNGISRLWIRIDHPSLSRDLAALMAMNDEQVPVRIKARILYDAVRSIVAQALTSQPGQKALEDVEEAVALTIAYLSETKEGLSALLTAMRHDSSLFTHSVNVAAYAIGLEQFIGHSDEYIIRCLGLGAILHDVGKSRVPGDILTKPSPLSPSEWALMRLHPQWGVEALYGVADLPEIVLKIVRQHHEREDGSGYPLGESQDAIDPLSLVVSICDQYDALTSDRPYRPAYSPYQALKEVKKQAKGKREAELYASLVHMLAGREF